MSEALAQLALGGFIAFAAVAWWDAERTYSSAEAFLRQLNQRAESAEAFIRQLSNDVTALRKKQSSKASFSKAEARLGEATTLLLSRKAMTVKNK